MKISSEFIYENIFPIRIVCTQGNIIGCENLLTEKPLQITTNEPLLTTLKNSSFTKNAYIVLDFGKELHGRIRILTHSSNSYDTTSLRITLGESVGEAMSSIGFKGACNDHATRDFIYPIPDYSDIYLNESGFRFVKIELKDKNTEINIKAITVETKMRALEYSGSFTCSNERLNQIYNVAAYTCHLNMQQYIWDGIKRDRLVWVGDMHPEMLTVRTVFGTNSIIDNSLNFMRITTKENEWMNGMPTYSCWWIHILYEWYFYSGNNELLNQNKDYALKLIQRICNLVNSDGSDNLPSYFLDWPCNDKPQAKYGSRALLAISLKSASELCKLFNQNELSLLCLQMIENLFKKEPKTYGAKQVTAMCSLAGWINKIEAGKEILDKGARGWSTFMSYYLLKAASEYNMNSTLNALCQYYGAMLDLGATTFWEDFDLDWTHNATRIDEIPVPDKNDIHGDHGAFCYKGYRHSLCHGWASAPTAFLAEEVLGIKILEPGCKKIAIKPNLGNLDFAKGTYPTPFGILTVDCKNNNGQLIIDYTAPDEIEVIL